MADPRVVPRAEHTLSRRDVDPDALKVLYRLRQFNHTAYLVGGSVRDLLIGRRPKDFDIGTSAHPYQVKKLFRNCWIIGRRFRLAHVKFGTKVIEVATFRRQVAPGEEIVQDGVPAPVHHPLPEADDPAPAELPADAGLGGSAAVEPRRGDRTADHLIHHDNTFGTPEEDAFRRDFTINALFYDIATFSIIDYVDGLEDLRAGLVRSIGDPEIRFREDPVRMMRAVALAARLDFTIDQLSLDAIHIHRHEIARSSPRGCSRSTTRFSEPDPRNGRSASWRSSDFSSRFPRSCITAPPRHSGNRWGRSTGTAADSSRYRTRSPTPFYWAA